MPFDTSASALGRVRWITPGEFTALLHAARGNKRAWMLFFTVGNLGLRCCEAHRLTVADISPTDDVIRIRTAKQKRFKRVMRDGQKVQIDNPNAKPIDEIPVAHGVMLELRRWIKAGTLPPAAPLFPWHKRHSQTLFDKYATKAGIKITMAQAGEHKKGRGIHCLRHLRGLALADKGVPIERIQALLRQRSVSSAQVYWHVTNLRKTVDDLGTLR